MQIAVEICKRCQKETDAHGSAECEEKYKFNWQTKTDPAARSNTHTPEPVTIPVCRGDPK